MNLQEEIDKKSKEINADSYSMSVGEIISLYKEGELNIHPEFQRFFRWKAIQKTKLIESLLLNIPIPPIFVSQNSDGVWDVVDGLQRLSTILQFVGVYKDESGKVLPPLVLQGTKLLPSLEGMKFNDPNNPDHSFTPAEQRYLKRAKFSMNILLKESDPSSKYELFQRLNTGGTSLSEQEVRNCLMVMNDKQKFEYIKNMSEYIPFQETLRIGENYIQERYDMELAVRFICLRHDVISEIRNKADFGNYLNDKILSLFDDVTINWETEVDVFKRTFDVINEKLSDNAFLRYDVEKEKYKGGFNIGAFEIIAICLGKRNGVLPEDIDLSSRVIALWKHLAQKEINWKSNNAFGRLTKTLELGEKLYENKKFI